jgi:hypothetical protein
VCERRYVVNVKIPTNVSYAADGRCPRFRRPVFEPFTPKPYEQQIAEERIVAPGPKTRQFANITPAPGSMPTQAAYSPSYGLGAPMETGSTGASSLGFAQ